MTDGRFRLRLAATSDLHVAIHAYDYFRDCPDDGVGLGRIATLVEQARAEVPNLLLFDNGDLIQGNPLGDFMAERGLAGGAVHPVIRAMNAMGYDAATVGNHEFNYGLDFLTACLAGARFPYVSANLHLGPAGASPAEDRTLLPPFAVLERRITGEAGAAATLRVGVIGLLPPQTVDWDRGHLAGRAGTRGIVSTAAAYLPALRAAGADIVVALCHSGIGAEPPAERAENAVLHLSALPGIDAIVAGHAHRRFPGADFAGLPGADLAAGRLNGVPVVMPGVSGSDLGIIDLELACEAGRWRVCGGRAGLRPIARRDGDRLVPLVAPHPAPLAAAEPEHQAALAHIRRPVGRLTAPVTSYFALAGDCPAVQLVARAQAWYVADCLKGGPHAGHPLLSAAAAFKVGGRNGPGFYTDVPAGDIAIKHVADLYLYPNLARAVMVTGAQVREWLERSAGAFNRIVAGDHEQPLLDPDFPAFDYDVIAGLTYRIDLGQPARYDRAGRLADPGARRIVDLAHGGRPVAPDDRFVVATNSYRAGGGGTVPGADGTTTILEAADTVRDALLRFIAASGTVDPAPQPIWSFLPIAGATQVTFDSAPAARDHLPPDGRLIPAGPSAGGFAKYRIDLSKA